MASTMSLYHKKLEYAYDSLELPAGLVLVSKKGPYRKCCYSCLAVLTCSCVLLFMLSSASYFSFLFVKHITDTEQSELAFEQPLRDSNGLVQSVRISIRDNYVQYYIEASKNERNWILDDFNAEVEIMRKDVNGISLCYVSRLDKYVAPEPNEADDEDEEVYKDHVNLIYSVAEQIQADRSLLGSLGQKLCSNSTVYWIRQSDAAEVNDVSEIPEQIFNNSLEVHQREKRAVGSQCRTSCCMVVCCCKNHHFTWETTEHFSCVNVCDRCTNAYRRRIC